MKKLLVLTTVALVVGLAALGSVQARGINPAQLGDMGWTCFVVPDLGVHCTPPSKGKTPPAAISVLVFGETTDPGDADAELSGTEILIRADLYHDQPCPQEGLEFYVLVLDDAYRACHQLVRSNP